MYVLWGDRLMEQTQQPAVGQTSFSSVIINGNNVTSYHFPGHGIRLAQLTQNEAEMRRHYSAMWLLLPFGLIFILVLVRLLTMMFNRCPQMIAAALTGIFGTIVVFFILMTLDNKPIYS